MAGEKSGGEQESGGEMSQERFYDIYYNFLRGKGFSKQEIEAFVSYYVNEGRNMVNLWDAKGLEKKEFREEQQGIRKELESRVQELTDAELVECLKKYGPGVNLIFDEEKEEIYSENMSNAQLANAFCMEFYRRRKDKNEK